MTDAPPAARATRPGWRDPRLWVGVALVAGSVLLGASLLGGADDDIEVWVAAGDLRPGQPVTESDLAARRVRFADADDAGRYFRVGDALPEDAVLARGVGEGELLPAAALGGGQGGLLEVPIPVPPEEVAATIDVGSVVDVWITDDTRPDAELVLDDVVVLALPSGDQAFGPSGNQQVLVGVDDPDDPGIGRAIAAAKDGRALISRQG